MRTLITVTLAALALLPACDDKRATNYVEEQLPAFRRLGPGNAADLKIALQPDISTATRKDAAVQAELGDAITELAIWSDLSRRDSSDADAVYHQAAMLMDFGDVDGALERLERLEAAQTKTDKKGAKLIPVELMQWRCAVLRRLQRLEEAQKTCEAAILAGAGVGSQRLLVKIHLARGDSKPALEMAEKLAKGAGATGEDWYDWALALDAADRASDAQAAFDKTLLILPSFTPAELARSGKLKTVAERQQAEVAWQRSAFALKLAQCWHLCAELELEDRAKRCAQEADKIEPGRVDAQRVLHLLEVDPGGAVKEADSLLGSRPHPDLFAAKARALMAQGQNEEARRALQAGLALDPASYKVHSALAKVCATLGDAACATASEQRLLGEVESARHERNHLRLIVGIIAAVLLAAGGTFAYFFFRRPKRILPP